MGTIKLGQQSFEIGGHFAKYSLLRYIVFLRVGHACSESHNVKYTFGNR